MKKTPDIVVELNKSLEKKRKKQIKSQWRAEMTVTDDQFSKRKYKYEVIIKFN